MVYIVKVFIFAIQKLVIMQLAEIVSVTGMPGIFQVKGKRGDGLIVTSLVDGKSQFVSGRVHMFSTLDNITIYTTDEPVALKDVLAEMKKQEGKNPPADPNGKEYEIKKYFGSIIPTYDTVKVYLSDMKKLIKWYNLLNGKGLIDELVKDEATVTTEEKAEGGAEEKPKKATKKAADKDGEKSAKPKAEKASTKAKVAAPRTNAPPKKITTPRKAS